MKRMKGLRDIIILSMLVGSVYYFFGDHIKFFFSEENRTKPYIDLYGRDGFHLGTQSMIQDLHRAEVPYNYYRIENAKDEKKLAEKLEAAGLDHKNYSLPVLNVNGKFYVNPNSQIVIDDYSAEKIKQDALKRY